MSNSTALFRQKAPGIMRQLMADFDLTVEEAAAILGNLGHESGGFRFLQEKKPLVPGSRGGWGWAQWTGPRRREFEAWVKRKGFDPASDLANYSFLYRELVGSEKKAIPALKGAKGLEGKVKAFENAFERAGIKHYESRYKWAERALEAYRSAPAVREPSMPKPDPVPSQPDLAPFEVEAIQKRLRELGYYVVGKVDGLWGPSTSGAITQFQEVAGLPTNGLVDGPTRSALATDEYRKPISEARANTTAKDLAAQGSEIVLKSQGITFASVLEFIVGAAAAIAFVAQNYQATEIPFPFNLITNFLPPWAIPLLMMGFALYNYLKAKGVIASRVESERSGMHNGEPDPAPSPPVTHAPDSRRTSGLGGLLGGLFGGR